jgi:hypothetical protein
LTSRKSLNLVLAFLIMSMEISWFSWELSFLQLGFCLLVFLEVRYLCVFESIVL